MEGYAKLAGLMGDVHTDGHFLIFQKFEQLSAQNLLYLQAEIANLQETLQQNIKDDLESGDPDKQMFSRDWWALRFSDNTDQWETWLQLRRKLKEYCIQSSWLMTYKDKAISMHQMVSGLPQPHKNDLNFLQQWLERPNMGNCSFVGVDKDIYESQNASGLLTLALRGGDDDPLTLFLLYTIPKLYHRVIVGPCHRIFGRWLKKPEITHSGSPHQDESGIDTMAEVEETITSASETTANESRRISTESSQYDIESNIFLYRDSYFHHAATILGTLISSLIPIAAIVALYFVSSMSTRLAMVCLFTALFSVALCLVTAAKRVEIFAATAAFASVQVVFVGSTNFF